MRDQSPYSSYSCTSYSVIQRPYIQLYSPYIIQHHTQQLAQDSTGSSSSHHSSAPYLAGESSIATLPFRLFVATCVLELKLDDIGCGRDTILARLPRLANGRGDDRAHKPADRSIEEMCRHHLGEGEGESDDFGGLCPNDRPPALPAVSRINQKSTSQTYLNAYHN